MADEMLDDVKAMLHEGLVITDRRGIDVLAMGITGTVYFADPWLLEVREAVARCAEAYMRQWAPHLRWALHPHLHRMQPFGEGMGSEPSSWLPDHDEEDGFSVSAHAAPDPGGASAIHVRAYCPERHPYEQVGRFRIGCPLVSPADIPFSMPAALLDLCNRLRPLSGTGGIGVVETVEAAVRELDPRFTVHRWEAGLMIQAGDHPELGDAARDAWPALQVKLARYLTPIRAAPEGDSATALWLRRFDGR